MSVPRLSATRQAKRRYRCDQEILVTNLENNQVGYLPALSLIRDERSSRVYEVVFEASTDNGRTWTKCGSNDHFVTFKA